MQAWIDTYDAAGIVDSPDTSLVAACNGQFIVASPMQRALESVAALGLEPDIIIIDALYEAPLPVFNLPLLTLNPLTWAVESRILLQLSGERSRLLVSWLIWQKRMSVY